MQTVRWLPFEVSSAANQMAADEALLQAAAETGIASLRFYGWAEPAVSLGYFQPAADRAEAPLAALPWVRRVTGGAALVHHHELTYAFALPAGRDWQPVGESWICRVHHAIQAVLAEQGVPTRAVVCGAERKLGPVLCFLHQTAGDVTCAGHKIVGSAQRKSHGALLQHGGILLGQSACTPELPGLAELAGVALTGPGLAARLAQQFTLDFGWQLVPGTWAAADEAARAEALQTRFANPAWNTKR